MPEGLSGFNPRAGQIRVRLGIPSHRFHDRFTTGLLRTVGCPVQGRLPPPEVTGSPAGGRPPGSDPVCRIWPTRAALPAVTRRQAQPPRRQLHAQGPQPKASRREPSAASVCRTSASNCRISSRIWSISHCRSCSTACSLASRFCGDRRRSRWMPSTSSKAR